MKYTIQNAIAYREELERLIGKLGGRRISTNRDWVSFDGTESMIEAVIEFLQQNDENGNSYITAGDRPDNIIYDPKDMKMTNKHQRYKVGDVNDSYNRVRSLKGDMREADNDDSRKWSRQAVDARRNAKKTKYKVGDKVLVTLAGLQQHSRSIPAHLGYSRETMSWRERLSGFLKNKTVGTVERVFDSGNLNVDFEGHLMGVDSYMVEPANATNATNATTENKRRTFSTFRLLEKYEDTFSKQYEMGRDEKRAFVESIRNYEQFGQAIYRGKEIEEAISAIANMVETAMGVTLKETDGWFDNITATRHTKQMKEALKVLQTEAKEIMQRQQRLEAAYEDIGQLLGRYYDV